jgi:hypothetical protein
MARVRWEGTTGGRPEEAWRAPARRSWSGGEVRWWSWRQRRPGGRSERLVHMVALGGQGIGLDDGLLLSDTWSGGLRTVSFNEEGGA